VRRSSAECAAAWWLLRPPSSAPPPQTSLGASRSARLGGRGRSFGQSAKPPPTLRRLEAALDAADALGEHHDAFAGGAPGGATWHAAAAALGVLGVPLLALPLRQALHHPPSRDCVRALAHATGGAALALEGSLVASQLPRVVAALQQRRLSEQARFTCEGPRLRLWQLLGWPRERQAGPTRRRSMLRALDACASRPADSPARRSCWRKLWTRC